MIDLRQADNSLNLDIFEKLQKDKHHSMNNQGFTTFRVKVVIRILAVIALGSAAFYVGAYTPFSLMVFWLTLFAVIILIDLIRYVEKANRDLGNFLMAIKQNDFSNIYPEHNRQNSSLFHAFNVITREFTKLRSEKESNFHFFKTLVEYSGVPLLTYDLADERIHLMNESAKDLFKIPYSTRLESIGRASEQLLAKIRELGNDERILVKTEIGDELFHLSVLSKVLILQERRYKVLAFHNINTELDQQEIESWQKLIRVLTHEIKNSVIPISTLTEVAYQMLENGDGSERPIAELDDEEESDLRMSLFTIGKRSKSLVKFVNSYGDLAKVPKPKPEEIDLIELVSQMLELEMADMKKANIKLTKSLPKERVIRKVDPGMIEQVLINLIKNGIEALEGTDDAEIQVALEQKADMATIRITDNGPGMNKELLNNIFVPFYTTKEAGSGIGLPLSRQIMRAHKGSIKVLSTPGEGTSFELNFRF